MRTRTVAAAGAMLAAVLALSACGGGTGAQGADGGAKGGATSASPAPKRTSGDTVPNGTETVSKQLEYYIAHPNGEKTVALTFDDGPSGTWTPRILAELAKYNAHATFCEIGPNATANPGAVKQVLAAGDRLCDHSVHHNEAMSKRGLAYETNEIVGAKQMIEQAGGEGTQVSWFRAPGGDFSPEIRQISAENGLRPLAWSVDTNDWKRPGVAAIVATVKKEVKPGSIILMHDGGGDRSQTVAALAQLLPWLVQQGYSINFPDA
ncbi:polysaccharide deacetylase family protein [Streptacidiphilus jiangxiensis]|uniref:Peptidoglycan/xylan/chitin deacetylase, PgdA/CDA1 family n=1 Tax=Streptacidiphilus jiangxiensis TaxID=235985 RepID=A0A1H7J5L3_STRJI|nr:polysaccharide deacetylase family protein [Streptacidiphilus jiangxiensis]SEK69167.1 Peptidoglycan/xylan/chitin deacetylase, PgdA/CDA1 family [Streptacidiphilus jiangxiensis]